MAKLTNVRERVHQPFWDSLIRTAGFGDGQFQVNDSTDLFTVAGKSQGESNLVNGSTLPSDQSHVTLALRVFVWYRSPVIRGEEDDTGVLDRNGDLDPDQIAAFFGTGGPGSGNAPADYHDVHRNYWQTLEQLHWNYGTGEKFSLTNMQTKYMPDGGGLSGDIGGATDLIHWNNGDPSQQSILRLARAILLPPRQNVRCQAVIIQLPSGANATLAGSVQNGGNAAVNTLSLRDNLNRVDAMNKVIQFTFDGLFARDVQ
jgi:hypothetical protein